MDSKNDPRSIDWAPTEIANLREEVGRISENMTTKTDNITDRIFDLERRREEADRSAEGTDKAVARLNDRISALEETVAGMSPYVELADRVLRLEKAMADHASETVKAVWSDTVRQLDEGQPWNLGPGKQLDEDTIPQFGAPWSADEFNPPIGGLDPRHPVKTQDERHGGLFAEPPFAAMKRQAYQEGLAAGRWEAQQNAARRLRNLMTTEGWAPHFVDRLTAVVLDTDQPKTERRLDLVAIPDAERRIRAKLAEMGYPLEGHHVEEMLSALRDSGISDSGNGVQQ